MEPILDGMLVIEIAGDPAGEMLGKLLAGQYHSPHQCMATVKRRVDKAAEPFRKG